MPVVNIDAYLLISALDSMEHTRCI